MHRPFLVATTALLLAACGGGGDSTAPAPTSVATVSLNITAAQLGVGNVLVLTATPLTASGTVTTGAVSWGSSAPGVAAVTQEGRVTGIAPGVATITAKVDAIPATATITVSGTGNGLPLAAEVTMPGNTFSPFLTTIAAGGSVTFRFGSVDHNVIFGNVAGKPQDIQIVKNANIARTFNTKGLFPYDCTVHPGMSGQIEVK